MQVPGSLGALWAQRKRWARGQGEVMRVHLAAVMRWRNRRMWMLAIEAVASLIWIVTLVIAVIFALVGVALGGGHLFGLSLGWGIAIATIATLQLIVALWLDHGYDATAARALLLGALYPLGYWMLAAAAAVRSEIFAFIRGPRESRVVWDIPREPLEAVPEPAPPD